MTKRYINDAYFESNEVSDTVDEWLKQSNTNNLPSLDVNNSHNNNSKLGIGYKGLPSKRSLNTSDNVLENRILKKKYESSKANESLHPINDSLSHGIVEDIELSKVSSKLSSKNNNKFKSKHGEVLSDNNISKKSNKNDLFNKIKDNSNVNIDNKNDTKEKSVSRVEFTDIKANSQSKANNIPTDVKDANSSNEAITKGRKRIRKKTRSKQKNIRKDTRSEDKKPIYLRLDSTYYAGRELSEQTLKKIANPV